MTTPKRTGFRVKPGMTIFKKEWIPASAGMTNNLEIVLGEAFFDPGMHLLGIFDHHVVAAVL
jgi:hypothetical protein